MFHFMFLAYTTGFYVKILLGLVKQEAIMYYHGNNKGIWVPLTDEQWNTIKKYAKAKRDYEVGKGFTMKDALKELVDSSLMALEHADFYDQDGNRVDWHNIETR